MGSRRVRRVVEFGAVLGIAAAGMLSASPAALAHDHLVTTSPRDGSRVAALPNALVMTFEEPLTRGYTKVRVTDPQGEVVSPPSPTTNGSIVTVPLARDTAAGPYRVVWSVLSDDGHPVSGVLTFSVSTATTSPAAAVARSTASQGGGTWVIPVIGGIAAAFVIGASVSQRGRQSREPNFPSLSISANEAETGRS